MYYVQLSKMKYKYFIIWVLRYQKREYMLMDTTTHTFNTLPFFISDTPQTVEQVHEFLNSRQTISSYHMISSKTTQVSFLEELDLRDGVKPFFVLVKTTRIAEVSGLPTINIPIKHQLEWQLYTEVVKLANLSVADQSEAIGAFVAEKIVQYIDEGKMQAPDSDTERRDDLPQSTNKRPPKGRFDKAAGGVGSDSDAEDYMIRDNLPQLTNKQPKHSTLDLFNGVMGRSRRYEFPAGVRLEALVEKGKFTVEEVQDFVSFVHPAMHLEVARLMENFIQYKRVHGDRYEKAVYKTINSAEDLVTRCLSKRPMCFYGADDYGLKKRGDYDLPSNFDNPLGDLGNYINYDEMLLSALIGVHSITPFINNGNKFNMGTPTADASHAQVGLYSALVGCRFEKSQHMEIQHMVIGPVQNTEANGYGSRADITQSKTKLLRIWANFYGIDCFPTFFEASQSPAIYSPVKDYNGKIKAYFNKDVYIKRMKYMFYPFLKEADAYAASCGANGLVRMTGIGMGVWVLNGFQEGQTILFMEALRQALRMGSFPHISRMEIAKWIWQDIPDNLGFSNKEGTQFKWNDSDGRVIDVVNVSGSIEPASPLPPGKWALATCYAWDSNSYPGNEYWDGALAASGDPAAACCSTIAELQNIDINPSLLDQDKIKLYD